MSPKTDQAVLDQCKVDYSSGNWKSVSELASRYNINLKTLHGRINREGWDVKREELSRRIEKKVEETKVDLASEYLSNTFKRAKRLEQISDASLSQASLTNEGIPLVDLEQVDILTRSELRIHELAKSCLRIAPVQQVQVTGNVSLSLVNVIADLRKATDKPVLEDSQYQRIIDLADDKTV